MPSELPAVRSSFTRLGATETFMSIPVTTRGFIRKEERLSPERIEAIRKAVLSIKDDLCTTVEGKTQLRTKNFSGTFPYESIKPLLRRLGIPLFTREHETFDPLEYNDHGTVNAYRGMTLGEMLLAEAVADGSIVVFRDRPVASTRLTSSPSEAKDYAISKSKQRETATRILYGLQLDQLFGFTVDNVLRSILMSPILVRFANSTVNRHTSDYYKAVVGSGLPYFAVEPPMTVEESTSGFKQHTKLWSHIDLNAFRQEIQMNLNN